MASAQPHRSPSGWVARGWRHCPRAPKCGVTGNAHQRHRSSCSRCCSACLGLRSWRIWLHPSPTLPRSTWGSARGRSRSRRIPAASRPSRCERARRLGRRCGSHRHRKRSKTCGRRSQPWNWEGSTAAPSLRASSRCAASTRWRNRTARPETASTATPSSRPSWCCLARSGRSWSYQHSLRRCHSPWSPSGSMLRRSLCP
mmetsp:Transcript_35796/g.83542  ORF Transcript_35796/g.83542 Transcript_35796/m.83542 type:complete len:200 (+) Transcript_35796:350-949(+)